MKIGILTFHCAINYGALLQAYALQEYLKKQNHEVYVIDYRPQYLVAPYRVYLGYKYRSGSILERCKLFFREISVIPMRWLRKYKFHRFIKKNINLNSLDFNNPDNDFDAFVMGSDQIWNGEITNGFDLVYFGEFPAAANKRLLTYAASAGNLNNIVCNKDLFAKLIGKYSLISVREKSLANYIASFSPNVEVDVVVDPVLLLGSVPFRKIATKRKIKNPYILVFSLTLDNISELRLFARRIATQRNLQIIEMVSMSESLLNTKQLKTESPESFISLLENADYVVTSSFHGTAFSILFEKPFNTMPVTSLASERMSEMLSELNLSDRLVVPGGTYSIKNIDYLKVKDKLSELRRKSQIFIEKALS